MNFSLFSFGGTERKKDEPQKVICAIERPVWLLLAKAVQMIAAAILSVCAILAIVIASKTLTVATEAYRKAAEIADFQTRPVPVIEMSPDLRFAIVNRGERAIRSLKVYHRILYDNGALAVVDAGKAGYADHVEKGQAYIFSADFNKELLNNAAGGTLWAVVVAASPAIREEAVKIFYKNVNEPERWFETDRSLWTLGPDQRTKLSAQIDEITRLLREAR